jgi:4-hydroxythreonine-4-phosphate dehydrogenase
MSLPTLPRIVFTAGEPAGIGPDLCLQIAQHALPYQFVVIADPELLRQRAQQLKLPITLTQFDEHAPIQAHQAGQLCVLPMAVKQPVLAGELAAANSSYVLNTITEATQKCLDNVFHAMVTGPVHKGIINDAGFSFTGHTEFIAEITGGYPVMMLATAGLRVALVTNHLPLAKVSAAITPERLRSVIRVLHHDLTKCFNLKRPKIVVCGLNPHAGENGHLGREELDIIIPVLKAFRQQGMNIQGPLPADTSFTPSVLGTADAVLAMYHDQGLPVLKFQGFGQAVNITLGLPIIRTSVDHGTALSLAGTGNINTGSMCVALDTAHTMIIQHALATP